MFGTQDYGIDLGIYDIGSVRTLHDYEEYGGFDFKKCVIQDYTLKVNEPPNPLPWEEGFIKKTHTVTCEWDIDFFKNFEFTKPKFLTFGVMDNKDQELYRKDFTVEVEPQYVNLENNNATIFAYPVSDPERYGVVQIDKNGKPKGSFKLQNKPPSVAPGAHIILIDSDFAGDETPKIEVQFNYKSWKI